MTLSMPLQLGKLSLEFVHFKFDGFNQPWNFDLWVGQLKVFFHSGSKIEVGAITCFFELRCETKGVYLLFS